MPREVFFYYYSLGKVLPTRDIWIADQSRPEPTRNNFLQHHASRIGDHCLVVDSVTMTVAYFMQHSVSHNAWGEAAGDCCMFHEAQYSAPLLMKHNAWAELLRARTFFKGQYFFFTKKTSVKNIHFFNVFGSANFWLGHLRRPKNFKKRLKMSFFHVLKTFGTKRISLDVYGASPNSLGFSHSYQDRPPMTSVNKILTSKIRNSFFLIVKKTSCCGLLSNSGNTVL
jgi:hypothetical protein